MKKAAFLLFVLFLASCSFNFEGTLVKPKQAAAGIMAFSDETISIVFALHSKQLGFVLKNKSDEPIVIKWDAVSYISPSGRTYRVIHQGIRFIEKDKPMADTVIPPQALLDDMLVPTGNISFTSGQYGGWRTSDMLDEDDVGREIGVFFPIEIKGKRISYNFRIKITGKK